MLLRYLAGGATEDLRMIYGVSISEVYCSIWRAVDAVNRALDCECPLNDPTKLEMGRLRAAGGQRRALKTGAP
jgi:hypothetical protein